VTQPRVLMCSMWRNDCARQLVDRAEHLLAKAETYPALRWRWIVGDSTDGTAAALRSLAVGYDVEVIDLGDTGIAGDSHADRLRRLSVTGNHYFRNVGDADYVLIHESDIRSPHNVVNLLVANAERGVCPVAAWPVITLHNKPQLYDIWAYRKDGVRFSSHPPYHDCYKADQPFIVDSAGTVLLFHAEDTPEVLMDKRAILDLCWHLKKLGRDIWVDPTIVVEQPVNLWQHHHVAELA
jgi:hypothetical protein